MRRIRTVSPAGKSVVGETALSETTQTSAARAPSPIDTARASSCSAIRQKPPGMMGQRAGRGGGCPAVVPYRRGRQPHQFLADKIDAALVDRVFQPLALAGGEFTG